MSKMNGPTRKKLYLEMADGEGEFCRMCGVTAKKRQLVIDHKDNNNSNNRLDNRQFLCRPCNYKKNPRRPVDECVSDCEEGVEQSELEKNRQREPEFRKFTYHELNESGRLPELDVINSGAEAVGISPVTAKRYLNKMCSSVGILCRTRIGRTVVIQYKNETCLR